jgi:hypothetical protein
MDLEDRWEMEGSVYSRQVSFNGAGFMSWEDSPEGDCSIHSKASAVKGAESNRMDEALPSS